MRALSSEDSAAGHHAREIAPLAERARVARAVGQHEQRAQGGHALGQGREELLAHPVDPVQVLDHHHLRPRLRAPHEHAAQGLDGLGAPLRGRHRAHLGAARVDGQERAKIRRRGRQIRADRGEAPLDLRGDRRLRVPVLDAEQPPEQVDQRVERHGPAEGQAVPLVPRGLAADPPAQLGEQARLAHARLRHEERHLPLPAARALEGLEQEAQLPLPSHEGREPALGRDLEPRAGLAGGQHFPRRHRLGLALDRQLPERPRLEEAAHEAVGRVRDRHVSRAPPPAACARPRWWRRRPRCSPCGGRCRCCPPPRARC